MCGWVEEKYFYVFSIFQVVYFLSEGTAAGIDRVLKIYETHMAGLYSLKYSGRGCIA